MAIRNIREDGDEILRKKSREVEVVDDKIREILEDMVETMHKYNGVGLAAPQIGLLKRLIVIDLYDDKGPIKLVNPEIIKEKGTQEVEEGCLSFPNKFAKIIRPEEVTVKAKVARKDKDGKRVKEVVDGKKVTVYDEVEKTIKKDKPSRLHARREMLKVLYSVTEVPTDAAGKKKNTKEVDLVAKLFDEIAPKYADRNGGYTRIVKIGQRKGDGALEVLLELV